MFSSLKTKIILLITLILTFTAAVILYFTHRDVGYAMIKAKEVSIENILKLVELNISAGYNQLLLNKIDASQHFRNQLKTMANVAVSSLESSDALCAAGKLSTEIVQKSSLDWFKSTQLQYADLLVFDQNGKVLAYSNSDIRGISIATLEDIKGRKIADAMRYDTLSQSGDYAMFEWGKPGEKGAGKKLGYFLPFKSWKWTIGTVVDVSDIEAAAQKKLEQIIKELSKAFAQIYIASSGSAFLFNGKKEILIAPRENAKDTFGSEINALTGKLIIGDLINSVASSSQTMRYRISTKIDSRLMEAKVKYFKPLDWYIATTVPIKEIQLPAQKLVTNQSILIALIFLGSLIAAYFLVSKISRPLKRLSVYAKDLSSLDFTIEEESPSLIDDLPKRYKDEVGQLANALLFMEAELKKNIKTLIETTAGRERIQSELNIAREIQLGILTKIFPAFPEYSEFQLYAMIDTAKEVGGDLYDFFLIDSDHLCFSLGDVSDKGVPAALFMMITKTLIKTIAETRVSTSEMMFKLNNILSSDNPRSMFVTLIIGILNIRTGEVRYTNGGHNPPIVISKKDGVYYKKQVSGLLVGAMEDSPYKEILFTLLPGDNLFLYTDGVTEAMNTEKIVFSDAKLLAEIDAMKDEPIETVIKQVREKVLTHAGSAPQSDDIAMLMLRYVGNS